MISRKSRRFSSSSSEDEDSLVSNTPTYEPKQKAALGEAYDYNVRPFIDLIDKLRKIGLEKDVSLPTVVIIGDQSSGKSSALESISAIQLPRGSGITTRCPLELKMKNTSQWSAQIQYTTIQGEPIEKEIRSPSEIDAIIRSAQEGMTKSAKDISDDLISLNVCGPDVPNLSVVDLPGIARIAFDGQTKDICKKIKKLIYQYAEKENTIILCVIPCNQDVATNESLNIAKEVDPDGKRTLAVLTKPDLVDKGTENDVLKLMSNKVYTLQKGYSMIKCRSQKEIDSQISVEEARNNEEEFFKNHEYFRDVYVDGLAGVKNLAEKLTCELVAHIKTHIPEVREQLQNELKRNQTSYEKYGRDPPRSDAEKHMYLIEVGNLICKDFEDLSKGQYFNGMIPKEHRSFAVVYQFFEELNKTINENRPNECDANLISDIKSELYYQRGVELPPFLSYNVCKHFVSLLITKIRDPIFDTIHKSANSIFETTSYIIDKHTQGYPQLRAAYTLDMQKIHTKMLHDCQESINILLEQEDCPFTMDQAYFNAVNIDMPVWHDAVRNHELKRYCSIHQDPQLVETEKKICKPHLCYRCLKAKEYKNYSRECIMAENISTYMKVAFTRLMDNIGMSVIYHLFRRFSKQLSFGFGKFATDPSNCALIAEEKSREKDRLLLKTKIERLQQGLVEISNF